MTEEFVTVFFEPTKYCIEKCSPTTWQNVSCTIWSKKDFLSAKKIEKESGLYNCWIRHTIETVPSWIINLISQNRDGNFEDENTDSEEDIDDDNYEDEDDYYEDDDEEE